MNHDTTTTFVLFPTARIATRQQLLFTVKMRILRDGVLSLASLAAIAAAANVWGFEDASLTVQAKGAGVGGGAKEQCVRPFKARSS